MTRIRINTDMPRGERLIRASGLRYTIVRPGWFVSAHAQIAQVLVASLATGHGGRQDPGMDPPSHAVGLR
jgi:uncharacterized protein YbjT (DUF2867 family)